MKAKRKLTIEEITPSFFVMYKNRAIYTTGVKEIGFLPNKKLGRLLDVRRMYIRGTLEPHSPFMNVLLENHHKGNAVDFALHLPMLKKQNRTSLLTVYIEKLKVSARLNFRATLRLYDLRVLLINGRIKKREDIRLEIERLASQP